MSISVRERLPWPTFIGSDGQGWDEALDAVMALRNTDALDPTVFDVGIVDPADTYEAFCKYGCVGGLNGRASATRHDPVKERAALVLGYSDSWVAHMAHELGHALGRAHAPCGTADHVDPRYPYARGRIGHQGYRLSTDHVVADDYGDMMGYCPHRAFVSDYTYAALFDQLAGLTAER